VPAGDGAGKCCGRAGGDHDDGPGNRVSGEWDAGCGDTELELADVHRGGRATGDGGALDCDIARMDS